MHSALRSYKSYRCVDPLDGEEEFIKRNGQFVVNIVPVRGDTPIPGVVTGGMPGSKTART